MSKMILRLIRIACADVIARVGLLLGSLWMSFRLILFLSHYSVMQLMTQFPDIKPTTMSRMIMLDALLIFFFQTNMGMTSSDANSSVAWIERTFGSFSLWSGNIQSCKIGSWPLGSPLPTDLDWKINKSSSRIDSWPELVFEHCGKSIEH